MEENGWGKNFGKLIEYYARRLINITQEVSKGERRTMVWHDQIVKNTVLPADTIVQVWSQSDIWNPTNILKVTIIYHSLKFDKKYYINL